MLFAIVSFAAALAPACPVPAAPADAVVISATKMTVEAAGGAYVVRNGWPAPGEARVGSIRYQWGFTLRSDDPRFADFDLSPGPSIPDRRAAGLAGIIAGARTASTRLRMVGSLAAATARGMFPTILPARL